MLDEAGLEAGGAEGAERDEGASAPAPSSEPRSPLPPAVVVVATRSVEAVVPVAVTGAPIGEVGSFPSAFASGPEPASASADLAPEPIPRPVAESASPPMPAPDPLPTSGADGLSAEPAGNGWVVTFEPFGSGVAGVAVLTVESEPGPEVGAEVGVGAAVGPGSGSAVGAVAGAKVVGRSGETVAYRSGAPVDSGPGVAEDSGLAGVAGSPDPAGIAEDPGPDSVAEEPGLAGAVDDPEPAGVADGSRSAGVNTEPGVEAGCEAATWVASGDDALGAPGESEAPSAAEDAVRAESAGAEPTAVSADDPDRGVTRTRAGVPM